MVWWLGSFLKFLLLEFDCSFGVCDFEVANERREGVSGFANVNVQ